MKKQKILLTSIFFILFSILVACGQDENIENNASNNEDDKQIIDEETNDNYNEENQDDSLNNQANSSNEQVDLTQTNVINIEGNEFGYTPSDIKIKKGKEYELVFANKGEIFHDLNIEGLDVEVTFKSEMPGHPENAMEQMHDVMMDGSSSSIINFYEGFKSIVNPKKVFASGDHDDDHEDEHSDADNDTDEHNDADIDEHEDEGHEHSENTVHMNANGNQTVKIKFIAKETGIFKLFCSVTGHEQMGMFGEVEVVE